MRTYRIVPRVLAALAAVMLVFGLASCQEPQNNITGTTGTLSVRVIDTTDAKTISPEGNVDVSHYVITLHNDAEGIHKASGYIAKNETFSISGVPAGTWYATVEAYVERDAGRYLRIAESQSAAQLVYGSQDALFSITLDSLLDELSGYVSLTLVMPPELRNGSFNWSWTMTGLGDRSGTTFSCESDEMMKASDGEAAFSIPAVDPDGKGTGSLLQGSYLLEFSIYDGADYDSSTTKRKAADVMRLLSGEAAYGTLDFHSDEIFEGELLITVQDDIGNQIRPETSDGETVYELDWDEEGTDFSVSFTDGGILGYDLTWYLDGTEAEVVPDGDGTWTFSDLGKGRHTLIAIVIDPAHEMAVGSLSIVVDVAMNPSIGTKVPELPDHTADMEPSPEIPQEFYPEPDTGLTDTVGLVETMLTSPIGGVISSTPEIVVNEGETGFADAAEHTETVGRYVGMILDSYTGDISDMFDDILGNRGVIGMNNTDTITIPASFTDMPMPIRLESGKQLILAQPEDAKKLSSSHQFRFEVDPDNPMYVSVDGALYSKDMKILYSAPKGSESFKVDERTERIAYGAFLLDPDIRQVDISNVTAIEGGAFAFCYNLETINLENVTELGVASFAFCYSLDNVEFSDRLTSIPANCFSSTHSLDVRIPSSVRSIGDSAFASINDGSMTGYPERSIVFEGTGAMDWGYVPFQYSNFGKVGVTDMEQFAAVFGGDRSDYFMTIPDIAVLGDGSLSEYADMLVELIMLGEFWVSREATSPETAMTLVGAMFGGLMNGSSPFLPLGYNLEAGELASEFQMAMIQAVVMEVAYDELLPIYSQNMGSDIPEPIAEWYMQRMLNAYKNALREFGVDLGGNPHIMAVNFESGGSRPSSIFGSYASMMDEPMRQTITVEPVTEEMVDEFVSLLAEQVSFELTDAQMRDVMAVLDYWIPATTEFTRSLDTSRLYTTGNPEPDWL